MHAVLHKGNSLHSLIQDFQSTAYLRGDAVPSGLTEVLRTLQNQKQRSVYRHPTLNHHEW